MNCKFCNSENLSNLIGGNWVDTQNITSSKRVEPISEYDFNFINCDVKLCSDCGRITEFKKDD